MFSIPYLYIEKIKIFKHFCLKKPIKSIYTMLAGFGAYNNIYIINTIQTLETFCNLNFIVNYRIQKEKIIIIKCRKYKYNNKKFINQ